MGGWVVGDGRAWVRQYSAPNVVGVLGDRKLKALIFYTINPLLIRKMAILCVFEPPLWGLRRNAVHLRFIRKLVVGFLLVIELFFAQVDALRANIDSKSAFFKGVGQFSAKFQVGSDIPQQPFVHR